MWTYIGDTGIIGLRRKKTRRVISTGKNRRERQTRREREREEEACVFGWNDL